MDLNWTIGNACAWVSSSRIWERQGRGHPKTTSPFHGLTRATNSVLHNLLLNCLGFTQRSCPLTDAFLEGGGGHFPIFAETVTRHSYLRRRERLAAHCIEEEAARSRGREGRGREAVGSVGWKWQKPPKCNLCRSLCCQADRQGMARRRSISIRWKSPLPNDTVMDEHDNITIGLSKR